MREFVTTFKFRASFLFAVISLLIVMIAGLLRDVRFVTIAWRSLLAFFVAGAFSYLIIFILEFKGIINFDYIEDEAEIAEIQEEMREETEGEEEAEAKEEETEGEEEAEAKEEETTEGKEEESGFKPLNADNLDRIAS